MLAMLLRHTWRVATLSVVAAALMLRPALAADVADADVRAVRAVVEAQLAAFAADDAERAFSYASEGLRERFAQAGAFMAMVRTGYPMVIKPAAVSWFVPTEQDGVVVQKVHLRDAAGANWLAVYQLQREAAAGWKIAGCAVAPQDGQAGIL